MKSELDFSRRSFVRAAGVVPVSLAQPASTRALSSSSSRAEGKTQLTVTADQVIHAETPTLLATIEKGFLTSLKSKASSEEFIVDLIRIRLMLCNWSTGAARRWTSGLRGSERWKREVSRPSG